METLKQFTTAKGIDCEKCRWCNHENMDCVKFPREVTNKLDFGTHTQYPIASAVRHYTGKCKPEAVLFEPRN